MSERQPDGHQFDGSRIGEEDAKLVTLARGARGRIGAPEGAAIRDELGRTYAGATVTTEHLALAALELAVASAIAAGARGVEAAVVVGIVGTVGTDQSPADGLAALRDLGGPGVPVLRCAHDGTLQSVQRT